MLEQLFNSPDVANAGFFVSGAGVALSAVAIMKGISDFRRDEKAWSRIGSALQVSIGAAAGLGAAWVGAEAWTADHKIRTNAEIIQTGGPEPLSYP